MRKDTVRDYDFIYTDGFVSEDKTAAAAVIDNYSPLNISQKVLYIISAELQALYLALDRVETADDEQRHFIIFTDSKSALQAKTGRILLSPRYYNAFIG